MELEEMKRTWGTIGRQLEEQITLNRAIVREAMARRASDRLRPLKLGQIAQVLSGIVVIVLAIAYYKSNLRVPHRLIAGVVMHVYGVAAIMLAGMTLSAILAIDWCEPVAEIQRKLERLRSLYLVNSIVTGLSWWILWLPFMQIVFGLLGADFYANTPATFHWSIAAGVAGILATIAFYRWSHRPGRESLRRKLDEQAAGASISGAFDELRRMRDFEEGH
jgi:hypothetical protein